ncbi:unnamed protein product [Ixodes hexagonus]
MATHRRAPAYQVIDGEVCYIYFDPILYRKAHNFEPQDGDIIEVTYPRCGSHWIQQIIQLILERGESAKTFEEFSDRAPFLEMNELKPTKKPRLIRTHLPIGKVKFSKKAKYVYVARNPWDCCVSCFHLIRETPACKFSDGTFDDFLDTFLRARMGAGDYLDNVMAAFDLKDEDNVFFVTYEELHERKADVIVRLADFLGEEYGRCLRENEEVFHRVVAKSTLSFMKEFLRPNAGQVRVLLDKDTGQIASSSSTEMSESKVLQLVRQGTVGDWKRHFSAENIRAMQAYIDTKTKGSKVMSLWKDLQM